MADVDATIRDLVHNCHPDIDLLLVPGEQRTMLLSDSGICTGSPAISGWLTVDDEAASGYPGCGFATERFKPTDDACAPEADSFPAPAPPPPYPVSMSVFDGTNPNGVWALYVFDDSAADASAGGVSSGWTLTLTTPDLTKPDGGRRRCEGVPVTLAGTRKSDKLRGTPGRDVIEARGGADKISGIGGDDLVCGGNGNDRLRGNRGKDILVGGMGKDVLVGGKSRDKLFGRSRRARDRGHRTRDRCPKAGRDRHRHCRAG